MPPRSTSHPVAPRRKPRQSRALHTSLALQQAFVRLLVEQGYARMTIREIVALAGTGLGSFYEYFASKEDLARVCLHLRTKTLLAALRDAHTAAGGRPLREMVDAVIDSQLAAHTGAAQEWSAHYLLERHFSSAEAYRTMYDRFVGEWASAFDAASDLPAAFPVREAARVAQTILYGLCAHTYIRTPERPDVPALDRQARQAIHAYLGALLPG
ncbi:MAG: TetR/AcrR family transcriptional regulator [Comamonas sp.]